MVDKTSVKHATINALDIILKHTKKKEKYTTKNTKKHTKKKEMNTLIDSTPLTVKNLLNISENIVSLTSNTV